MNCGNRIDDRQSVIGMTLIHRAVLSENAWKTVALNAIIQCNANLDTEDSNWWTALIHAAYHGDIDSAAILIKSGADVNAYSNQQKSALHFAS